MSKTRRSFTPEFKAKVVLELLKGEKELNELATEHQIAPNQLRKWKTEFLQNASNVFSDKRADTLQDKLKEERKKNEQYAKKVGQLTMQVDWLEKKSEEILGPGYEDLYSPKPFKD